MADCTRLYYKRRLMNTIESTSTFRSYPRRNLNTPEQREELARDLIQGWVQNASYDPMEFTIVHGKTDPVKFHPQTDRILRESRENIGVL